jgi:HD-GYP domain-containing protein (c-di-GMP phosphodiesterase class II)
MKAEHNINNQALVNIEHFIEIGTALSSERDVTILLEKILVSAKSITHADGGTIYSVVNEDELKFEILLNDSLQLHMGGSSGVKISFPNIPMYIDKQPNNHALVAYAAVTDQVINIADAYQNKEYNLTAARAMDKRTHYTTQSILTIPMKNHQGELIGVIQLINAQLNGQVIAFTSEMEKITVAMTSMAAVALTNRQLIDDMEQLFQSFTRLIAKAIDEKSPYTGGHCRRVPELTMMMASGVINCQQGMFADFSMSEEELDALSLAGWLHDCGKVATPEHVMDKATKLHGLFDGIDHVNTRFELAISQLQLSANEKIIAALGQQKGAQAASLEQETQQTIKQMQQDRLFINEVNTGGEFMSKDLQARVAKIAEKYRITIDGVSQPLLSDQEITNLQVARGTLNKQERQIINRHMDITIEMLDALPFPKHLKQVPEYACGHHEKMDGSGYPRGLTKSQLSVPARMMGIADIFEALTASDRPYKPAKKLTECLKIMGYMKKDQHIDGDLFDIFVHQKVYLVFAKKFLPASQIDEVIESDIPFYQVP